ncbi:hypothetical protein [Spirosoma telluris]|uniref:hypothetical protein n=1 Tax=Spirosoma telluris TaxID=2183553 RepID=UPI002FC33B24
MLGTSQSSCLIQYEGEQLAKPTTYLYLNYQQMIGDLLLTTQSPERTESIVKAVINQAIALGKSSHWVEQELKFEGMLDGADRADFLRLELEQADVVDDTLLDIYNERINRLTEYGY